MWPLLLCVCFVAASSGQTPAARTDVEKFDASRDFVRARNARDYAIDAPNGIDEANYVEVGGIQQWVTIRGEDRTNPILLFLHGGPGDATNPTSLARSFVDSIRAPAKAIITIEGGHFAVFMKTSAFLEKLYREFFQ
jgi:hypothetical protein